MKNTETQPRHSQQQMVRRVDAHGLVALQMDWQNKVGTPEEAEAKAMLDDAKELWREEVEISGYALKKPGWWRVCQTHRYVFAAQRPLSSNAEL